MANTLAKASIFGDHRLGLARTSWRCGVGMAEDGADSYSSQKKHETTD